MFDRPLNDAPRVHPIPFTPPMVRAIMADRKTVTRRLAGRVDGLGGQRDKRNLDPRLNWRAGDFLWVREAHWDDVVQDRILYKADDPPAEDVAGLRLRPAMFMRRVHSRIALELLSCRLEHLLDVTEEDAEREGFVRFPLAGISARDNLLIYWAKLNKRRCLGTNPLVWRIEFRRCNVPLWAEQLCAGRPGDQPPKLKLL